MSGKAGRHNAFGNRVAKLVDGVITEKYLWENKTRLLATFDGNNNLKHSYEYTVGNTPTSYYAGNQRYYILTDQLGSPRIITDSAGNVLREIEYDSYGNIIADSNPAQELPFGFAGGLYDQHTGLVRFGFRDYDPETGRWTARDPIGFAGGDTNLYGYVLEDPVNMTDPTGEFGVVGALIGGTANALGAYFSGGDAADVAMAFGVGAATGFFTGGLSGAAGSITKWAATGAVSGAVTGGATTYALGGSASDVLAAAILGGATGTVSGSLGHKVAFKNAIALFRKKLANGDWKRSDLAGNLAAALSALGISLTQDQLADLLNKIIKERKCQ